MPACASMTAVLKGWYNMPMQAVYQLPPLSLYIHIPWCIKKCPYCDFNSHTLRTELPENQYIEHLTADLSFDLPLVQNRVIESIFIGGGTPSLFSGMAMAKLLQSFNNELTFSSAIEITIEANPGTFEQQRFTDFYNIGINRISLGVQSFQNDKLKRLGRIHDAAHAKSAVIAAKKAGFTNINIDLMFGLPEQSLDDAIFDLQTAIELQPTHISWYQLTLEPNTLFYANPPLLPEDELIWEIQQQGQALLRENCYWQYEVSAYAQKNKQSLHNLNYWLFGDYLGLGAGAHGKITSLDPLQIIRTVKHKHPKKYLDIVTSTKLHQNPFLLEQKIIPKQEIAFEFMLNALRLQHKIPFTLFEQRTGLSIKTINNELNIACQKGLLKISHESLEVTEKGKQFLNDVTQLFL
jgi:oxygen-independent coproporphyrinogen-3 oxidase